MNKFAVPAAARSGKGRVLLRRLAGIAASACLWAAAPANAENLWCDGTLANLWVDSSGTVFVRTSWRNDYVQVCNVNQANGAGIQPTTCLSWFSLMRSAVQRNAETTMYYSGVSATACNQVPIYSGAPSPYYVMLKN